MSNLQLPKCAGGAKLRFAIAGQSTDRLFPKLPARDLRSRVQLKTAVEKPQARVAFYPGCMIEFIYPEIGEAVVDVLRRNNVEVLLPAEAVCCGIPHYIKGDEEGAVALAKKTAAMLADMDVDAIVVACATCGSALKKEYLEMYNKTEFSDKVFKLSNKVYDISEFLTDKINFVPPKGRLNTKITYHDPCHLCRWQDVTQQPRQLLNSIPGAKFIEMNEPDLCCGASGTFSFNFYELSSVIQRRKVLDVKQTEAEVVATGCPMCAMQLRDGANQAGLDYQVMHTVEILNHAYRNGDK